MTRQVGRGRNGSRSRVDLRGAHSGAAVGLCTQWCGCSKTVSWVLFCGEWLLLMGGQEGAVIDDGMGMPVKGRGVSGGEEDGAGAALTPTNVLCGRHAA